MKTNAAALLFALCVAVSPVFAQQQQQGEVIITEDYIFPFGTPPGAYRQQAAPAQQQQAPAVQVQVQVPVQQSAPQTQTTTDTAQNVPAQPAAQGTAASQDSISPVSTEVQIRGKLFDIVSQGSSYEAETLLRELELRFEVYNKLFRFNVSRLSAPLKVRSFTDKKAYDDYVRSKLGSTREGAVYLHYNQADRRELVINRGSIEESRVLPHQAFIQFIRAFVPYPPTWMREGFAIYFNTLKFNKDTRELTYEENLSWLETVKAIAKDAREPSLESVLLSDVNGGQLPEYFHPVSWALVSFFLNSGGSGDYFRSLTESFLLLDPAATAADNDKIVLGRLTSWVDLPTLHNDYESYIASRQTFAELIDAGQRSYSARNFQDAESYFLEALYQKPVHYAPYYYLGLIAYEQKNYDMAEQYYRSALQFGADSALVQYALGINAATAGKTEEAINYLTNAAIESPERYKAKVDDILDKLSN